MFIAITDLNWFRNVSNVPGIDEVNFWVPGGSAPANFEVGEPILFKLHKRAGNKIVGGGFFAHFSMIPVSLAWSAFKERNGAHSLVEMREMIEKYKGSHPNRLEDYNIGCILLEMPFFLDESEWLDIPPDWSSNIQRGKRYDFNQGYGKELWDRIMTIAQFNIPLKSEEVEEEKSIYGSPVLVRNRLGQGSFRVIVMDTYHRKCAVTQEKVLPALEAAHIKPISASGPNKVTNGIFFRSDIHKLFDAGYVTVTKDHHFEVSTKLKADFHNGKHYYQLHGSKLYIPDNIIEQPDSKYIEWHNDNLYLG